MTVIDDLLRVAYEDTELLRKNDSLGDKFSVPRDVDFLFRTQDEKKAQTVCSFINDNQYGHAQIQDSTDVLVIIHMPIEQNIICSISGLMVCIAHLFGVEYDGWGSVVKSAAQRGVQADSPASGGSAA